MGAIKKAPAWSKALRTYIISQLATWKPFKDIWLTVTNSEKFFKETGLTPLDPVVHNYGMFRMRCKRIQKNEIAIAHKQYQEEMGSVHWAEDKARVQGLSDLIDRVSKYVESGKFDKDTTGTLSSLVGQLRGLYEQVRKEVSADADRAALSASGTRVLLANPKNVQLDVGYVTQLLLICREEIGGLHQLDLSSLNVQELELLRSHCQATIDGKMNEIRGADYVIIDDGDVNDENAPSPKPEENDDDILSY